MLLHTILYLHPEANFHLFILKILITTLRNQDKKVAFIQVDEDGKLARYSEFMKTCHNMNIIVKTIGGDAYSIIGKSESPNNTLASITIALTLNSSHKKELWCFSYKYTILLFCRTENRLRGDVPYFLLHGTRSSYKHIKIWGMRV